MGAEVQAVHQVTDELVQAAGRLLPQLSESAAPLDAEGLARIADHQAITLFVGRTTGARSIDLTSRTSRVAANRLYQQLGFQLRDSNVYRYQPGLPAP
ncbi:MAG TPA: hypothetical protein VJ966_14500 [Actinomycetes bacterium]|nr:hypothetical protein [Actinomycetes bacterium]